jgi:hypothetical protein
MAFQEFYLGTCGPYLIDEDDPLLTDLNQVAKLGDISAFETRSELKVYFDGIYVILNTAIKIGDSAEVASSANRGTIRYVAGGAGVPDKFEVCIKSAADIYSWETFLEG